MSDNWGRIFGALAALAALWIFVYWWWEPSNPRISLDPSTPAAANAGVYPPAQPSPVEPRTTPESDPKSQPPRLTLIPPRFRDYVIQRDDTLESIAQKELGSRSFVDALRSANALMDPEHLKMGRTIRIPLDPTNVRGKPVEPSPPPPDSTEYTIKSGDTLSGIAKAHYGSTKFKDLIFEANRDRLSSEDGLREGHKLRLPPKPK